MHDTSPTLTGQFAQVAREAAHGVALIFREGDLVREYTYGQLYRHSLAVAGWLKARRGKECRGCENSRA